MRTDRNPMNRLSRRAGERRCVLSRGPPNYALKLYIMYSKKIDTILCDTILCDTKREKKTIVCADFYVRLFFRSLPRSGGCISTGQTV